MPTSLFRIPGKVESDESGAADTSGVNAAEMAKFEARLAAAHQATAERKHDKASSPATH